MQRFSNLPKVTELVTDSDFGPGQSTFKVHVS